MTPTEQNQPALVASLVPIKPLSASLLLVVFVVATLATSAAFAVLAGASGGGILAAFMAFTVRYAWIAGAVTTALFWLARRKGA